MPEQVDRYAPARRLHELKTLLNSTGGVTVYDIAERLGTSVRTAIRYLRALERAGEPLYEEIDGRRKVWRLRAERAPRDDHADDEPDGRAVPVAPRVRLPRRHRLQGGSRRRLRAARSDAQAQGLRRRAQPRPQDLRRQRSAAHLRGAARGRQRHHDRARYARSACACATTASAAARRRSSSSPTRCSSTRRASTSSPTATTISAIRTFALDGFRAVDWLQARPLRLSRRLPSLADFGGRVRSLRRQTRARAHLLRREGRALRPASPMAPHAAHPKRRRAESC